MLNNVSYKPIGIDYTRTKPELKEVQEKTEEKRIERVEENKTEELRVQNKLTPNSLGRYIDVRA
ncbi:MAG: hypothetical protein PHF29_06080 [Candidatus Riflebacteria bacterium]|nr:hypothetical protein [Candidatus Riflebacteria bacterium]